MGVLSPLAGQYSTGYSTEYSIDIQLIFNWSRRWEPRGGGARCPKNGAIAPRACGRFGISVCVGWTNERPPTTRAGCKAAQGNQTQGRAATDPACCLQACVGKVNTRLGGDGPRMFLARLCREGQRQCSVEYQLNIS